jgi:hypothetical protein
LRPVRARAEDDAVNDVPDVLDARNGDVALACEVAGAGSGDLACVPNPTTNLKFGCAHELKDAPDRWRLYRVVA